MARIFIERRDMDDELRRLYDRLDDRGGGAGAAGECTLPLDVVETGDGVEFVMDLAGVTEDAVRVLFVRNTLVIMGRKQPSGCEHRDAAFHLAERTFGRFARGVRLAGAFDAGRAEARLHAGELRVTVPRIAERRGTELRIPVRAD